MESKGNLRSVIVCEMNSRPKKIGKFLDEMAGEVVAICELNNRPKAKRKFAPTLCGMNSRPK